MAQTEDFNITDDLILKIGKLHARLGGTRGRWSIETYRQRKRGSSFDLGVLLRRVRFPGRTTQARSKRNKDISRK